jgi:biopolymer transport protein ExbD
MLTNDSSANLSELTLEVSLPAENNAEALRQARLMQSLKVQYRADQQEKFLHLQAETDSLLQQLRALKQQKDAQPDPVLV